MDPSSLELLLLVNNSIRCYCKNCYCNETLQHAVDHIKLSSYKILR